MTELGYALSSEEHGPDDLIDYAARAEAAGCSFALLSDHFHPWLEAQGESPFAWTTLGGIARETTDLRVGTGVTCPIGRIHPAIVAQAAATTGALFEGRFFLGVGTGERLNEHVTGERWPPHPVRVERLEAAVSIMRELWTGDPVSHEGDHFTVEAARLFTRPREPPAIAVAAGGPKTASVAGRIGDALVSTAPSEAVVDSFADEAGDDAPRYGQATVCWAESEAEARETVHTHWPTGALPGALKHELATPGQFGEAVSLVSEDEAVENVACGPDADRHIEAIDAFVNAGYDHVYLHQVGPDQAGFLEFYEESVLPSFGSGGRPQQAPG